MKRCNLFNILFLLICGMQTSLYAQAPLAIPYQAVARDNTGNPLVNQAITLRFSLHDLVPTGTIVFQETQQVTTSSLGLFSINIGNGVALIGNLSSVNWANGAKHLQVELDPNGGTNYTNMGTTQLMSVPYALFAANGRNTPSGNSLGNTMRWSVTTWVADNSIYNDGANIGIGTTTPQGKLHVAKTGDAEVYIESIGAKKYSLQSSVASLGNNTTFQIIDRTLGVTRLGIDNIGNVGIGTNTPSQKLDVNGTIKTTNLQISSGANNGFVLKSDANGNASWVNANTLVAETDPKIGILTSNKIPKWNGTTLADGLLFDNGTNIGINTTSPTNKLSVNGNTDITGNLGIGTTSPTNKLSVNGNTDITGNLGINGNTDITGKLGIGTTSPINKLSVNGNTDITGKLGVNTSTPEGELQIKSLNISNSVLDQQQLNGNSGVGGLVNWQSFTAGVTGFLSKVDLMVNSPTWPSSSPGTIKIFNGEGNGGTLLSTTSVTYQSLNNSVTFQSFTLANFVPVVAGNIYTIEFSTPSMNIGWIGANTDSNLYAGGSSDQNINWDYAFKTYVSTQLIDALVVNDSKVGIGTTVPSQTLDVVGTTKTTNLQITNGATNGFVLKSDANGNASWVNTNTLNITETDPKVGSLTSNKIPKWNGTTLSDGLVFDNGTNVGIGTSTPAQKLEVNGTTKTSNLQITNGAANGFVLKSDANGNASWVNTNTLNITETDPKVGSLTSNKIPKWNGTTLSDGLVFDNGTNVGIGTITPAQKLEVNGTTKTTNLQITNGAANGFVLKSDANGNASWANANTINITETDPKVGSLTSNKIPKWNGTTLSDGLVFDNGTNLGIGTTTPSVTLDVNGGIKTKYSGTSVIITSPGTNTPYQISIPALPAGWDYTNTVVLISEADGAQGYIKQSKLTSTSNIDIYFEALGAGGPVRFNWIIFKM